MSTNSIPRGRRLPAALLLALAAAVLTAGSAEAATIHACVKPKSGATRIVSAKAKCRHGEQKLSWNRSGPSGPAGNNGANGSPGIEGRAGANGTGPVYAVGQGTNQPIGAGTIVLTKVLPPGSYLASAKTTIVADATVAGLTSGFCELSDQPGTTGAGEAQVVDLTGWEVELAKEDSAEFDAELPLSLEGAVSSNVTSTLSMACVDLKGAPASASFSQLSALSVASVQ